MQKYQLSANELSLWLKYIEHQIGFVLPITQINWVKSVIERHLDMNHFSSSTQLLSVIGQDKQQFHKLFDDILIPRTQFFRHMPSFRFIEHYTKAWKKRYVFDKAENQIQEKLYGWSVGCSSGQEAYSMALTFQDVLRFHPHFLVYGSDFHQNALNHARQGVYDSVEWQYIPTQYHQQLNLLDNNKIAINPYLKKHLSFFSKNLVNFEEDILVQPKQCQVIICKNVLIYFRQFEQRDIIHYLTQFLADDGILIIGAGENLPFVNPQLTKIPLPMLNGFCRSQPSPWLESVIHSFTNEQI